MSVSNKVRVTDLGTPVGDEYSEYVVFFHDFSTLTDTTGKEFTSYPNSPPDYPSNILLENNRLYLGNDTYTVGLPFIYTVQYTDTQCNFSDADFTIEFFLEVEAFHSGFTSTPRSLFAHSDIFEYSDTDSTIDIDILPDGTLRANIPGISTGGGGNTLSVPNPYKLTSTGVRYHVALVRSGNSFMLFIDGQLCDAKTGTGSFYYNSAGAIFIGYGAADSDWALYLDNYRITIGAARYTENFVVPSTPLGSVAVGGDPNFSYVSCLMHFNPGAGLIDEKGSIFSATYNIGPYDFITTSGAKYGGSIYFYDSAEFTSGGHISTNNLAPFTFSDIDFTIEFNIKLIMEFPYGTDYYVFSNGGPNGYGAVKIYVPSYSGYIRVEAYNALESTLFTLDATTQLSIDSWNHVALTRNGNTFRLFVDGVPAGSVNAVGAIFQDSENIVHIGGNYGSTGGGNFLLDEFRVTKGLARYTATFTPPSSEHPNIGTPTDYYIDVSAQKGSDIRTVRIPVRKGAFISTPDVYTMQVSPKDISLSATSAGAVYAESFNTAKFYCKVYKNGILDMAAGWVVSRTTSEDLYTSITTGTDLQGDNCYIVSITGMEQSSLAETIVFTATLAGKPTLTATGMVSKTLSPYAGGVTFQNPIMHVYVDAIESTESKVTFNFTRDGVVTVSNTSTPVSANNTGSMYETVWVTPVTNILSAWRPSASLYINIKYPDGGMQVWKQSGDTLVAYNNNTFEHLEYGQVFYTKLTANTWETLYMTITFATDSSGSNPISGTGQISINRLGQP